MRDARSDSSVLNSPTDSFTVDEVIAVAMAAPRHRYKAGPVKEAWERNGIADAESDLASLETIRKMSNAATEEG